MGQGRLAPSHLGGPVQPAVLLQKSCDLYHRSVPYGNRIVAGFEHPTLTPGTATPLVDLGAPTTLSDIQKP
jgi:hypothetical protein